MSRICEVIEWGFTEIFNQLRYLDFRALMKVFEALVGRYFTIEAFFCVISVLYFKIIKQVAILITNIYR